VRNQPTDWEKMFVKCRSDKGFVSRIYKKTSFLKILFIYLFIYLREHRSESGGEGEEKEG